MPSDRSGQPVTDARAQGLRILHVAAPAVVGGLERVVEALAIGHSRRGHEVHVAAVLDPSEAEHPFLGRLRAAGVETHSLVVPARGYWEERRRFDALCRRLRPAVVHSHSVRTDVVDPGAARRSGFPIVTTIHGESLFGGRSRVYEWLQRRSYRGFDAVVAVSRVLRDRTAREGVPEARIHLIPNAWPADHQFLARTDARRELGVEGARFLLGWVGRMIPVKGGDVFLKALAQLSDLPLSAVMVGDGPERRSLESLARASGLGDRVRFVGQIPDAGRLHRAFDLFALTSRSEGMPIVLLEAMAAQVPALASRVGGVPDVVGTGGWLIPREDPGALARAVRERTEPHPCR